MRRAAWGIVAAVFLARAVAAFVVPLTGDEAYYWEWSRHPAFGYADHPPLVAWTIAAFDWIGHDAGFVRLGFVACGIIATVAIARCAFELTGDPRAGAVAALAFALTPLASLAFGSATPDGPYLMFWALALWFAVRAFKGGHSAAWVALGVCIGGVVLSRILGLALVFGLVAFALTSRQRSAVGLRGLGLALGTALVVCAPFLVWNAQHGWATFAFALIHRHDESHAFSLVRLGALAGAEALALSPGIFVAILACSIEPRNALLAWTALPQLIVVALLSLFEKVEVTWIFGSVVSLCAMLGLAYVQLSRRLQVVWSAVAAVPAALLLALLFVFSFAPAASYDAVARTTGARLRNSGPFEIMTYAMVARDAAELARRRQAVVMTDGYGFSSVLDFDAGVTPVVIGYNWQGREARAWYPDGEHPERALFVDKEPLASRPDFQIHLRRACGDVVDGGAHGYRYGSAPPRYYYFTWCERLAPDGLAILRWERERAAVAS